MPIPALTHIETPYLFFESAPWLNAVLIRCLPATLNELDQWFSISEMGDIHFLQVLKIFVGFHFKNQEDSHSSPIRSMQYTSLLGSKDM